MIIIKKISSFYENEVPSPCHFFQSEQLLPSYVISHLHNHWSYEATYFLALSEIICSHQRSPQPIIKLTMLDHYFCLCSLLVIYLEPLYRLYTETSSLCSPRLKLQRYTLTQFNIPLWNIKAVQFSHFILKLFKILLYAYSKHTDVAVIILLFQTLETENMKGDWVKPECRHWETWNLYHIPWEFRSNIVFYMPKHKRVLFNRCLGGVWRSMIWVIVDAYIQC